MMRAVRVLLPLLLWACDTASLPAPSIVSVEPGEITQGDPSVLTVRVDAAVNLSVDYQQELATPGPVEMRLWIADQEAEIAFAEPDGTLVAAVPEALPLGDHDLRVKLSDGREAVRAQAFSVVRPSTPTGGPGDGGTGQDGGIGVGTTSSEEPLADITGFQIDPIQDPVRGVPFKITIRALGRGASTYQLPVSLRVSKGQVATRGAGSFSAGVLQEEIALSHPGKTHLLVEDGRGKKGLSNSFQVRPH